MIDDKEHKVIDDPLAEIRKIRDEHANQFNSDIKAMFEDIKKFAKEQNLKTVSPPMSPPDQRTGS